MTHLKNTVRISTDPLTGHCRLHSLLHKIGIADSELCRFCCMEEDIICDCMALSISRNRLLGMYVVPLEIIAARKPKKNAGIYTVHWTSGGSLSHEGVVR